MNYCKLNCGVPDRQNTGQHISIHRKRHIYKREKYIKKTNKHGAQTSENITKKRIQIQQQQKRNRDKNNTKLWHLVSDLRLFKAVVKTTFKKSCVASPLYNCS